MTGTDPPVAFTSKYWFNPNLLNVARRAWSAVHALLGGDRVWLAQSLSPAG